MVAALFNRRNQPMPGKPLNQITDRELFAALIMQRWASKITDANELEGHANEAVQVAEALITALGK
jgi:hypothetical protein